LYSSNTATTTSAASYQSVCLPIPLPGADELKRFLVEQRWLKNLCEVLAVIGWGLSASKDMHQTSGLLILGVSLYVVFNFGRVGIDYLKEKSRPDLKTETIKGLLRSLTTALFRADHKTYRASVLLPNKDKEYIVPVYRYHYGGASGNCSSKAKFPKGTAFAGLVWENPGKPLQRGDIPIFSTRQDFEEYYIWEFKLPHELVKNLSEQMRNMRSILCIALVDGKNDFIGVLSIDSTKPNAFDNIDAEEDMLIELIHPIEATLMEP
jgi:hypothetical protein